MQEQKQQPEVSGPPLDDGPADKRDEGARMAELRRLSWRRRPSVRTPPFRPACRHPLPQA